jgi:hypothetical protein
VVPALPVPRLIKFAGLFKDEQGKPRTGVVGVSFAVYKEQEGGAALWLETQNVEMDEQGHYTVLLGTTKSEGVPLELFSAGEPRWLGVQVNLPREVEQPRVLLASVPYALKASDADTLGGKPLSSFVLASPSSQGGAVLGTTLNPATGPIAAATIGGGGSANVVTKFDGTGANVINSSISDNGSRITAGEGIDFSSDFSFVGNAEPASTGRVQMFDRANVGFVIRGLNILVETLQGSTFMPTEVMRWAQSGNVGIGTTTPGQKLEVTGNVKISGTGNALVFPDGTVMTSAGAGTNGGTITGVTAGTGLTGGGTVGGVMLNVANGGITNALLGANSVTNANIADGGLSPAKIAGIAATLGPNTFMGGQSVVGNVSLTGSLSLPATTGAATGVINLGGAPFAHSFGSGNTFLGSSAGNFAMTGGFNTAIGANALQNNNSGCCNTASGWRALQSNTTGQVNTATGELALLSNTTGGNNTASGAFALFSNISGGSNTASGAGALQNNTTGDENTATGGSALGSNTTGIENTASGAGALQSNISGNFNTASGWGALFSNTTGQLNTAAGQVALSSNTTGGQNTATGANALLSNTTGSLNTASGAGALSNNTTGVFNTATGVAALSFNTTGSSNIAIGVNAGQNATTGNNNIYIGDPGVAAEGNTIRIGRGGGNQTRAFVAGISGVTTGGVAVPVLVDGNGQLGTTSSSRRFKYDIQDMGQASNDLLRLRPVAFRYKQGQGDGSHPLQYGLIAEEVAQVYPELVQYAPTGEVNTVLYHLLPAMLLNELQKQHTQIETQERQIQAQQEKLQAQAAQLTELRTALKQLMARPTARHTSARP